MKEFLFSSNELKYKLKNCEPYLKNYIVTLQSKLNKSLMQNAALQANNFSLKLRIKSLESQLKKKLRSTPVILKVVYDKSK